jgi:hypothetical protein
MERITSFDSARRLDSAGSLQPTWNGPGTIDIEAPVPSAQDRQSSELSVGNLRRPVILLVGFASLLTAVIYAYCTNLSTFSAYDDEGYMMLSVQGFLRGYRLYTDILSGYGPFYYFYEWFLHGLLTLPLTHDVTRILSTIHWLVAALLFALTAFRTTRSLPVALFVFMQMTFHLTALIREPGHPQEICVLLLAAAVVTANAGLQRKWTIPLMVFIGTALVFTKINLGSFFGFALVLTLMSNTGWFRSHPIWFWILLGVASCFPFFLMRPLLSEQWVSVYAWQICVSILTSGAVAYFFVGTPQIQFSNMFLAGLLFLGFSGVFLLGLLTMGISVPVIFESLVTGPSKLSGAFSVPLKAPYSAWSGAASLLAAIAVIAVRKRLDSARVWIGAAKALYGIIGSFVLISHYKTQLGYLLPWSWLVLLPCRSQLPVKSSRGFARSFLCLLSAWQGLQAYPVAGTQAAVATLVPVLLYSLCLYDAFVGFATEPWAVNCLRSLPQRTTALLETLLFVGLLYVFAIRWCNPISSWRYYTSLPTLGLRGASHLHLPADQVAIYQALTRYLESESDTFMTIPGLNSLFFWANKIPPTYFNVAEVVLLSEQQQKRVIAALENARRPLLVINPDGGWFSVGSGPLQGLLERRCRENTRFGSFHILEITRAQTPEILSRDGNQR